MLFLFTLFLIIDYSTLQIDEMDEDLDELIQSSDDLTDTLRGLLTNDNFEDVSSDESEEVNDQNLEDEGLPSHTFEVKDTIVKSGKRKGTNATRVSLIIENYIFRKRRELESGHVTMLHSPVTCVRLTGGLSRPWLFILTVSIT